MDDGGLIERLRAGERAAQREFYERHAGRIYSLLLRLSGNRDDAFDLAQDAFVRAFQHFSAFDGRADAGTWLYRIAVNEALQHARRRDAARRHMPRVAAERRARGAEARGEAASDVEAALGRLRPEQRAILVLRYQQGLSYAEIARVLDLRPGTIASRLNRARRALREALSGGGALRTEESRPLPHQT